MRTIAEISGLAVTTVSRALGDAPDISDKTKEKIGEIAKSVGYVSNRAGVTLRTGRTNVISLILATENDVMNLSASLIASISNGLQGTPYHLVMVPEPPGQDPLRAVRYIVETRSADVVIINRVQPQDARVAYLREQNFPFVTHGRTTWCDDHAYFDFDNRSFGRIAVEILVDRGRRNILMLAPPSDQNDAQDMIKGATEAAHESGVKLSVAEKMTSDSDRPTVFDGIEARFSKHPDHDALISASPNATMVATTAIEKTGRMIGAVFDIFAKETVPFLRLFRPGILSLHKDIEKPGGFLAKAATHEIKRNGGEYLQAVDRPAGL